MIRITKKTNEIITKKTLMMRRIAQNLEENRVHSSLIAQFPILTNQTICILEEHVQTK